MRSMEVVMWVHLLNVDNPNRAPFVMVNPELLEDCREHTPGRQYEHTPALQSSCWIIIIILK